MRELTRLPKAHLHVHLESTIRPATLREFGVIPPSPRTFAGFRDFADHNARIRESPRTPADFARIAREFCQAEHGIECRVLLDHSRRRPVERARETLRLALKYGVAGIGLAGEESYPITPFTEVLDAARQAGLHLVHHAGETGGPASIRETLTLGHAERVGHGIRALDDPTLVADLRGVPLEVCPSSNVVLGLVSSLAEHPLPRLRAAGLTLTISTDIPNLTGTTLSVEYQRIRDTFGWDDAVLAELNHAAVDASFASPATKHRLHRETDDWLG